MNSIYCALPVHSTPCWAHHPLSKKAWLCHIHSPPIILCPACSLHSLCCCWDMISPYCGLLFIHSTPSCWAHHPLSKKAGAISTLLFTHALLGYELHTVPCCSLQTLLDWDINSILFPACSLFTPHPAGQLMYRPLSKKARAISTPFCALLLFTLRPAGI